MAQPLIPPPPQQPLHWGAARYGDDGALVSPLAYCPWCRAALLLGPLPWYALPTLARHCSALRFTRCEQALALWRRNLWIAGALHW